MFFVCVPVGRSFGMLAARGVVQAESVLNVAFCREQQNARAPTVGLAGE